jgi:hypothetical protein
MQFLRIGVSLALMALVTSCVTAPDLKRVKVSSNVSSKILNLRNSGNGNTSTVTADRVMKNGFLIGGEEYGYYTLDIQARRVDYGDYGPLGFLGGLSLGVLYLLGMPVDYESYDLTVELVITDSDQNIVRSYSDSTNIKQLGGVWYGDATPKASRAYTRMIRNIQGIAAAESGLINEALLAAGPIRSQTAQRPSNDITVAVEKAAKVVMNSLKQRNLIRSKIAIVNISSQDKEQAEFVAAELEFMLVSNNFIIVDRIELDRIRREQNFQLSGEVDDNQIVSIGKFAGAGLVITGSITGSGNMRRLRLRVLNTQSAELMGSASEPF